MISEPPLAADSTTIVASLIPATIRFRFTKFCLSGLVPLMNSVSSPPCETISTAVRLCTAGYILSSPCAKTPTVSKPFCRAAL